MEESPYISSRAVTLQITDFSPSAVRGSSPNTGLRSNIDITIDTGPGRHISLGHRPLRLAYISYLVVEFIVAIGILTVSASEVSKCHHADLRSWIVAWGARTFIAAPITSFKLMHPEQNKRVLDWLDAILSMYVLVLFFWGNLLLFSPGISYCHTKSPISLTFVVVALALVYAYFALPVLIILFVCFCLPIIVLAFHMFDVKIDANGASERLIRLLPSHKFEEEPDPCGVPSRCAICMDDFVPNQSTLTILPCGHIFDRECIHKWLRIKRQCALCRHDITQPFFVVACNPSS